MSLNNATIIRSVYDNQEELLRNLMRLYCPDGFDLDTTYSIGACFKNLPEPRIKTDLFPQTEDTIEADSADLPFANEQFNSIIYDPPFVAGSRKDGKPGIIKTRFGYLKTTYDLWKMYDASIIEAYRVLKSDGILVVKCQDCIDSGKQFFSHVFIMNVAYKAGFYPKDLFILVAKSRLINQKRQLHARKYHCYFWVFKKQQPKVKYFGIAEKKKELCPLKIPMRAKVIFKQSLGFLG